MHRKLTNVKLILVILGAIGFLSCNTQKTGIRFANLDEMYRFESDKLRLEISDSMGIFIFKKDNEELLSITRKSVDPFYIVVNGNSVKDFVVDHNETRIEDIATNYGKGKQLVLIGEAPGPFGSLIEKELSVEIYEAFPEAAVVYATYRNVHGTPGLTFNKEIDNHFTLDASLVDKKNGKHDFWVFQGGSYKERPDWILPVTSDFSYENYQGQEYLTNGNTSNVNNIETGLSDTRQLDGSEVGGGIPVLDVWSKETGFFIGSLDQKPKLISLPAQVDSKGQLNIGIEYRRDSLSFDDRYSTIPTVIGVHDGDYYNGLTLFAGLMSCNGFEMLRPVEDAYKAVWCGWGFGPDFSQQQMIDMIPLVKDLGFEVVTVDAGWFYENGDYIPRDNTFPDGDKEMKRFVQKFHDAGLKVKLWITTHIAGPELEKAHPDWLVKNKNGEAVGFSYMKDQVTPYLCPTLEEVQEYHRILVRKFIGDWDYDGFKVDQSLINSIAKCYAPGHNHNYPEESVEALPAIYKTMYEEMVKWKPEAIFEVCPCGACPSFYKMPYYNQPVSSDFNSPWQIRHRGKTIKALMVSDAAYFGDHVERHFSKNNFPSMIGVGGIPGSMMVAQPKDNVEFLKEKYPGYLSPERKKHFRKWLGIYNEYRLSMGEYLNLYDIAFEEPETHVIRKDGIMYFSFYSDGQWNGDVEFRGLDNGSYKIIDYINNKKIGTIQDDGKLNIEFKDCLFVKAIPQ